MNNITLGWLRILLALMVVDQHYGAYSKIYEGIIGPALGWPSIIFCGQGNIAVIGFFVMSGYLVSEILTKKYPSNGSHDFIHFVASRYLRIYPLYIFILLAYIPLLLAFEINDKLNFQTISWSLLLLPYGVSDYFLDAPLYKYPIIGASWTLALDLVFYPVGYLLHKQKIYLHGTFMALFAYFILVWYLSPADALGQHYNPGATWWHTEFYTTIQPNMLAFAAGIMANIHLRKVQIPIALVFASTAALVYISFLPLGISCFASNLIGLLAFTVLVTYLAQNGFSKRESFFGSFTYALYLIHLPIKNILRQFYSNGLDILLVGIIINFVLAFVIAVFIEEMLIENNRRKWLNSWRVNENQGRMSVSTYNFAFLIMLFASMAYYIDRYD